MQASTTKAAEDPLLDILQSGFESSGGGLKKNPFVFIERAPTKIAHNRELYDLFDQHIERWAQFS